MQTQFSIHTDNVGTKGNTNIIGGNILAKDVTINTGNNLTIKSRQNLLESDSYSIGFSVGGGTGPSQGGGTSVQGNVGFNTADGFTSRGWVDSLTSVIGTNSVNINTGNNTELTGALIANATQDSQTGIFTDLGNLALNTKTLTTNNINNYNNSESSAIGINTQIGTVVPSGYLAANSCHRFSSVSRESSSDD